LGLLYVPVAHVVIGIGDSGGRTRARRFGWCSMILTFYLGAAAVQFKQYAAYMQRRTAVRAAQLTAPPQN